MEFLPLFFRLSNSRALVFGDSEAAKRKKELLTKAGCEVRSYACDEAAMGNKHVSDKERYMQFLSGLESAVWESASLVVAATQMQVLDELIALQAKQHNIPVNVVNQPDLSSFIFPSIIDRTPVVAAVSSSGEMPVLTRLLRSKIESSIPHAYGRLALFAQRYRGKVREAIPSINLRRRFWEKMLEGRFADLVFSGREEEAESVLGNAIASLDINESEGEVYLVGAGPGDPDLLTFKALRLIRQADVVLYDRLVADQIVQLARQDAKKINVGKERSRHTVPQDSINDLLVKYAKAGHRVLRLKGGDPFIFGRGGEEIESLAAEKIPFQVVPGITAASGCAAYSGIPLTHRDYSQSVRFITGHLKNNTCDLPWNEFVQENQTLVFYMGLHSLPVICRSLIKHGLKSSTPVALISRGTTREQQVVCGSLVDISEKVEAHKVHAPTLIIIGKVVQLRDKLNWFEPATN